ncbi:MAG TPA: YihY family inner membrane protein [Burkholderiales bacterium]|nr:YihY family inner membrane protein [Burkholderiales bacterium]
MPRRIYSGAGYLHFVWKRFKQDRCLQAAGSLTFTTLLSLVPLITVALAVFAAFPVFADFSAELRSFIWSNLVPEAAGKVVSVYLTQFTEHAARLTALGIIFLGVTALMLMLTIDRTLNTIWRVTRPRPLLNRLLIYWAVLTVGPVLIGASLSMTSWLLSASLGFTKQLPAAGVFLLKLSPLFLSTIAYALLFVTVPYRYVPPNHAFAGAVVAAVAFEGMKRGFAFYIEHVPSFKLVYGTFASVPIFLLWIYLSWLVFLLGAVIAASLPNWRGEVDPEQRAPGYHFYNALRILRALFLSLQTGDVMNLPKLRKQLRLGIEEIEDVLQRLNAANWVRKAAGEGWVLVRDPEQLTVADVYRLLVFDPQRAHPKVSESGIPDTLLQDTLDTAEMKVPLKTLFTEAASDLTPATR